MYQKGYSSFQSEGSGMLNRPHTPAVPTMASLLKQYQELPLGVTVASKTTLQICTRKQKKKSIWENLQKIKNRGQENERNIEEKTTPKGQTSLLREINSNENNWIQSVTRETNTHKANQGFQGNGKVFMRSFHFNNPDAAKRALSLEIHLAHLIIKWN